MSDQSAHQSTRDEYALAPGWHTGMLIALMVAVAATGALLMSLGSMPTRAGPGSRVWGAYVPMLLVQWGLAFYVCRVGRSRNVLRQLIGQGWNTFDRAGADVTLALLLWALIEGVELWSAHGGSARNASVAAVLPVTGGEHFLWTLVAVSVGFCEEIVYRGYLQEQLAGFTGRASVALVLQAALFGMAHAEQGAAAALRLGVYGVALGALALWRRSLLPAIVCHIGIDLAAGWIG